MRNCTALLKLISVIALCFIGRSGTAQPFTLSGRVAGLDTGSIVLRYRNVENQMTNDTAILRQGTFRFQGSVAGGDNALINTNPYNSYRSPKASYNVYERFLFIEPGVITMDFPFGEIGSATLSGANIQKEADALKKSQSKDIAVIQLLKASIDSVRTLLKNGSIAPKTAEENLAQLSKIHRPIWQRKTDQDLAYIRRHRNSYVSLSLLRYAIGQLPTDSIDALYANLSSAVKNSSLGATFVESYARYKKAVGEEYSFDRIKVGDPAPSFTLFMANKDTVSLEQFKGSPVLLEFWEMTCLPCLKANPLFERLRQQHSESGLNVIAVTTTANEEMDDLHEYIAKNKLLEWMHVSANPKYNPLQKQILKGELKSYYALGVPRTILIDRNGTVIYKNDGYSKEALTALSLALENNIMSNR